MAARRAGRDRTDLIDMFMAIRPRLIQLATRIIGCQCLAEDVVQETMLKICEGGIEDEVQSPAAYLFRMVRNLAIDCGRRRTREMGLAGAEDAGGELVSQCPCPEETMARCQALRIVVAALQELPERTRAAFEMHRIEGVSQRDIASQMQVSPTLVNFMVRDAHNHCRARLLGGDIDKDMVPAPKGRQARVAAAANPAGAMTSAVSAGNRRAAKGAGIHTAPQGGEPPDQHDDAGRAGRGDLAGENAIKVPGRRRLDEAGNKEAALRGKRHHARQQGLAGGL